MTWSRGIGSAEPRGLKNLYSPLGEQVIKSLTGLRVPAIIRRLKVEDKMSREKVFLICTECLSRNYTVLKRKDRSDRLALNKYCPTCKRHTLHKESK